MSGDGELAERVRLLDAENARLQQVLDQQLTLVRKEYAQRLAAVEREQAEREQTLRDDLVRTPRGDGHAIMCSLTIWTRCGRDLDAMWTR